ncbi:MAG: hypothetical protein Q9M91_01555 [Candidatus Dojkabacteria bacterium]|nr:hypothetical protein [Candidatus Dojkabacteria bacterium]MDQ7020511.1 hypothetical protein [Candidatus Dojkabacteria bacterium]
MSFGSISVNTIPPNSFSFLPVILSKRYIDSTSSPKNSILTGELYPTGQIDKISPFILNSKTSSTTSLLSKAVISPAYFSRYSLLTASDLV